MRQAVLFGVVLFLASATAAVAEPIIDVGNHIFAPGATRTIPIYVSSDIEVAGLNFYIQIGDGGEANGGVDTGPTITAVDIVGAGTIFANNNNGQFDELHPLMCLASTATDYPALPPTVTCNGLIANVTIDTTDALPGQVYSLHLTGVAAGMFEEPGIDTCFVDEFGMEIYPTITNGTIATAYAGDFNLDGTVDTLDLDIWKANFGTTPATFETGDANRDGAINGLDLDLWKATLNMTVTGLAMDGSGIGGAGVATVPEPGTFVLLLAAALGLSIGLWRKTPA